MARKERVTEVIDGDSFLTNRRKYPVRLADVDTPEKRQPGYQKAKQELQNLILDKKVTIDTKARDVFRRPIAQVKVGTQSVNKLMKKYQKK
jgi:micrococcal nuclease